MKNLMYKKPALKHASNLLTMAVTLALTLTANVYAQSATHSGHGMSNEANTSRAVRDPDAYSGGFTLDSDPYALKGPRVLVLADEKSIWGAKFDRLEYQNHDGEDIFNYEGEIFFGRDYDKLVLQSEGDIEEGNLEESSSNLLWRHAIASFWDSQAGIRYDTVNDNGQFWLTAGVQGLAPYWFEVDAMASASENGQLAIDLAAEYDILLTQKLIAQPSIELSAYSKDQEKWHINELTPDISAGLRLRYEVSRKFAPYIGIEWQTDFGKESSNTSDETYWAAGLRLWF
ncbi:copper resistance protein B [Parasalinivibrio latis]|uniref:copper resistance protein B n=1 Tax=Parasalinivibrio latis TaxID=2952610 RepID=UPI0030DE601E